MKGIVHFGIHKIFSHGQLIIYKLQSLKHSTHKHYNGRSTQQEHGCALTRWQTPGWKHLSWVFNVKYTVHRPWPLNTRDWGKQDNCVHFIVKILSLGAVEVTKSMPKQLISVTSKIVRVNSRWLEALIGIPVLDTRFMMSSPYTGVCPPPQPPQKKLRVGVVTL